MYKPVSGLERIYGTEASKVLTSLPGENTAMGFEASANMLEARQRTKIAAEQAKARIKAAEAGADATAAESNANFVSTLVGAAGDVATSYFGNMAAKRGAGQSKPSAPSSTTTTAGYGDPALERSARYVLGLD